MLGCLLLQNYQTDELATVRPRGHVIQQLCFKLLSEFSLSMQCR